MVFRRREKRPYWQIAWEFIYPRGGWTRAFYYVRHRLNRLPDSPERISRGLAAGVFAAFTPFFGLHFVIALVIARVIRGNYLASLMGTFFGNPVTYVPIAVISLQIGHWILGRPTDLDVPHHGVVRQFMDAGEDLWRNSWALFTPRDADWTQFLEFFNQTLLPFSVGSVIPGVICAAVIYYLSLPVVRAYQHRRAEKLRRKIEARRAKAHRLAQQHQSEGQKT